MAERGRVLLAETDQKTAALVAKELQQQGYSVVSATDAVQVLNMAKLAKPDVVLMNGQLAGGGGQVALKRLRSNVFTTHIPVLMILGGSGARAAELLAAGAQECIAPPLDTGKLRAAIERHLLESLDFTEAPAEVIASPQRLADVADTGLLDTAPEETFDRLTRLAANLVGAPTALVSLVDKDRQFFKSQVGLKEPWASERQTRLSHSFCQWVVSGQEKLVVGDARENPVLRSNLAIRDLGVIAYAGIPLTGRSGQAIGSFCAIDSKSRTWSEEDIATLDDLARVTQAYAVLDRAQRKVSVRAAGPGGGNTNTSLHVAGNAIVGAVRILRRHGGRLAEGESGELLAIIEEQGQHLVEIAESRPQAAPVH